MHKGLDKHAGWLVDEMIEGWRVRVDDVLVLTETVGEEEVPTEYRIMLVEKREGDEIVVLAKKVHDHSTNMKKMTLRVENQYWMIQKAPGWRPGMDKWWEVL